MYETAMIMFGILCIAFGAYLYGRLQGRKAVERRFDAYKEALNRWIPSPEGMYPELPDGICQYIHTLEDALTPVSADGRGATDNLRMRKWLVALGESCEAGGGWHNRPVANCRKWLLHHVHAFLDAFEGDPKHNPQDIQNLAAEIIIHLMRVVDNRTTQVAQAGRETISATFDSHLD